MGTRRNSAEIQQLSHAARSGPDVNDGRSNAKDGHTGVAQMRANPEGGELDQKNQRCKMNFSSVLSCIDKWL